MITCGADALPRRSLQPSLIEIPSAMAARVLSLFVLISSALGQVSTIGQVRQVSFDAEGLDADARDVTVVDDGNCCLLLSARTPRTNRLY
jgi:hypothetical protein